MAAGLFCVAVLAQGAAPAAAGSAVPEALRLGFERARQAAQADLFDRPLYLQSVEIPEQMRGEVYSRTELPYAELRQALVHDGSWCGVPMRHLNTQYCRASGGAGHEVLDAGMGRKFDQALPPERRQAQRARDWFDATDGYAAQLHEIEREDYLAMKQHQALRQLSQAPPPRSP